MSESQGITRDDDEGAIDAERGQAADGEAVAAEASCLGGLRVLDFTRVLAGPLATMLLADFGAEVTKVERPGVGDETRAWGPPVDEDGEATYFQSVNRNKRSVALDLTSPPDRERLFALALEADVLVENFRPGVLERFGFGYEDLRRDNPRLVYCSLTGFGSGAGAELPGYDLLIQAMGGLMSITGAPDGQPQKAGVALVDVIAGLFATVGILAALRRRDRTGEGQRVEVDLFSSLLAALVNQASAYTVAGSVARRMGNSHPSIAPYDLYAAAGGDLVLAVGNDRQFARLCEVLGSRALAEDPRFATNSDRVRNRADLRHELETCLAAATPAEWAKRLAEARVPAGQVNDIAGAFAFAEEIGLDPIVQVPREGGGLAVPLARNPIRLSATPPKYRSAPPPMPT